MTFEQLRDLVYKNCGGLSYRHTKNAVSALYKIRVGKRLNKGERSALGLFIENELITYFGRKEEEQRND